MPCTSDCCSSSQPGPHTTARYRKVLWAALAINFGMFIIEIVMSARSGSVSPTAISHSSRLPIATVTWSRARPTSALASSGDSQNIGR